MTNITITPCCGSLSIDAACPRVRLIRLVWEWVVCDANTIYEEEVVFNYRSRGPPVGFAINVTQETRARA